MGGAGGGNTNCACVGDTLWAIPLEQQQGAGKWSITATPSDKGRDSRNRTQREARMHLPPLAKRRARSAFSALAASALACAFLRLAFSRSTRDAAER